jgi:hypothetical protein
VVEWTRLLSHYRNTSWDNNLDLFVLKITRNLEESLLGVDCIVVSPLDILNSRSDSNHNMGILLIILVNFFLFNQIDYVSSSISTV